MASIRREIVLANSADNVWAALRDFGAVDRKVAPGFVTESRLDGDVRIVTFANGTVAREQLVDLDDSARRLVYAIANERLKHYNAAAQVFSEGADRCRFVWTIDFLPHEFVTTIGGQVDDAVRVMTPTLERK